MKLAAFHAHQRERAADQARVLCLAELVSLAGIVLALALALS